MTQTTPRHLLLARQRRERFEAVIAGGQAQARTLQPSADPIAAYPFEADHVRLARQRRERFEAVIASGPQEGVRTIQCR